MAEAALTSALSKLGELAVSKLTEVAITEAKTLLQVGNDIRLLRDELQWLQAFIRDADRERRQTGSGATTRIWVSQTRDVAFEAEDALDGFFDQQAGLKGKSYRRAWKTLRIYLSGRITTIKSRLDQILKNRAEYEIERAKSVPILSSTTAIAAWRDDMENTVGFDEDVKIIKKMMNSERLFVSIVGESGAGKNTLAKIICRRMRPGLEVIIWYHMEPGSSIVDLLAAVYQRAFRQCYPDGSDDLSGEEVIWFDISQKLADLLSGKSYLLILSGKSSKTILNCVRASLPDHDENNENGGHVMLILDTENEEVAWHANTMNNNGISGVHLLTRLDERSSGDLFFWKVNKKGGKDVIKGHMESGE